MKRHWLFAHFSTVFLAFTPSGPAHGDFLWTPEKMLSHERAISQDASISERECHPDGTCGHYHRRYLSHYLRVGCYFIDAQDRIISKFTDVKFEEDRHFPRSIGHVLALLYETSAKEKMEVRIDLQTINAKTKVMKAGNPARLIFECTSSRACIEIIPGGQVPRFRIGCTDAHTDEINFYGGIDWNTDRAEKFIFDYQRLYLRGL
jgi:hypothetical protein